MLATRQLKPSLLTNCGPPIQPADGAKFHVPVTGSRNWITQYWPGLTYQSPAGSGSWSPGASEMRFVGESTGMPLISDG